MKEAEAKNKAAKIYEEKAKAEAAPKSTPVSAAEQQTQSAIKSMQTQTETAIQNIQERTKKNLTSIPAKKEK